MKDSLRPYVPMADMLAETFGADCEVVLHDLDDPEHSVVYVANGSVTGRQVGESFDQLVRQVILAKNLKESFVSNYYFTAKNGKRIRSSTLLIKSPDGGLEGALCINLGYRPDHGTDGVSSVHDAGLEPDETGIGDGGGKG